MAAHLNYFAIDRKVNFINLLYIKLKIISKKDPKAKPWLLQNLYETSPDFEGENPFQSFHSF